mmetsp:Transcript_52031/g.122108  ORF Transcript_52031/g.122108 Transcript_52031/m.122108 type:complete len:225 (+) Transcript_52031:356-1030(+)
MRVLRRSWKPLRPSTSSSACFLRASLPLTSTRVSARVLKPRRMVSRAEPVFFLGSGAGSPLARPTMSFFSFRIISWRMASFSGLADLPFFGAGRLESSDSRSSSSLSSSSSSGACFAAAFPATLDFSAAFCLLALSSFAGAARLPSRRLFFSATSSGYATSRRSRGSLRTSCALLTLPPGAAVSSFSSSSSLQSSAKDRTFFLCTGARLCSSLSFSDLAGPPTL